MDPTLLMQRLALWEVMYVLEDHLLHGVTCYFRKSRVHRQGQNLALPLHDSSEKYSS